MKKLFLILLPLMLLVAFACSKSETQVTSTESTSTSAVTESNPVAPPTETTATAPATDTTATASATTTTATATAPEKKGKQTMDEKTDKVAVLHTTAGDIAIRFYPDVAPNHVKNFLELAGSGFYNGIKFHRVIPGFMIQVGDPNTKSDDRSRWGTGGSPKTLKAEFNSVHHARGIISAARTSDPDSASSQFFICVADAPFLDRQYTVFGKVVSGMDVADKIVSARRDSSDRPYEPTAITSVTIRDAKPEEKGPAPK